MKTKLIGHTSVRDNIKLSENLLYPVFCELYKKQTLIVEKNSNKKL